MKFDYDRTAGLRDFHVRKCERTHGRTPAPVPSYKLTESLRLRRAINGYWSGIFIKIKTKLFIFTRYRSSKIVIILRQNIKNLVSVLLFLCACKFSMWSNFYVKKKRKTVFYLICNTTVVQGAFVLKLIFGISCAFPPFFVWSRDLPTPSTPPQTVVYSEQLLHSCSLILD